MLGVPCEEEPGPESPCTIRREVKLIFEGGGPYMARPNVSWAIVTWGHDHVV